jgi:hypothetical protein
MPNIAQRATSAAGRVARHTGRFAKGIVNEGTNLVTGATGAVGDLFSGSNIVNGAINIVLIVYAVFIVNHLSATQLKVFDNTVMRLAVVLLILGLAVYGHHASAILLTVAFVMSIQAANRSSIAKFANLAVTSNARETFYGTCGKKLGGEEILEEPFMAHDIAGEEDAAAAAAPILPGVPTPSSAAAPPTFTTPGQFDAIQSNQVANNQGTEVRTWKEELGPQGLTQPAGFGGGDSAPASFDANTCLGGAAPMQ